MNLLSGICVMGAWIAIIIICLRSKWLRKSIESKIEMLIAECNNIEGRKALYPEGSLMHDYLNFAMALWDLKIAIWMALLGNEE